MPMREYTRETVANMPFFIAGEVPSTFDAAWGLAEKENLPEWASVIALSQTSGRGQLRRHWHSPPGNLYVSFFLPDSFFRLENLASMAVGLCVAVALAGENIHTKLKWPNDLLITDAQGREGKFGGLLLEERKGRLLAGLGLNLKAAPGERELRTGRAVPAAALPSCNEPAYVFWKRLLPRIRVFHDTEIMPAGLEAIRWGIENRLAWMGKNVHAEDAGVSGRILGINTDGSLRLDCGGAEILITSGSVAPQE